MQGAGRKKLPKRPSFVLYEEHGSPTLFTHSPTLPELEPGVHTNLFASVKPLGGHRPLLISSVWIKLLNSVAAQLDFQNTMHPKTCIDQLEKHTHSHAMS